MALKLGQQGSVSLLMTADATGAIISIDTIQSSGSSILDRAAREFVKAHWKLPQGQPNRLYQAAIRYLLTH